MNSAVGRALVVQHIGLSDLPGESKDCASDVRTTAESSPCLTRYFIARLKPRCGF
jgi:hypothetical protein